MMSGVAIITCEVGCGSPFATSIRCEEACNFTLPELFHRVLGDRDLSLGLFLFCKLSTMALSCIFGPFGLPIGISLYHIYEKLVKHRFFKAFRTPGSCVA